MDAKEEAINIEETHTIRKVLEWALTISMVCPAVYCVMVVSTHSKKDFYIMGYKPVMILSGSMEPYMKKDSIVIVKKTQDIKENDVIMFSIDEKTKVCHRAVAIDEKGRITTKGDNNEHEDFDKVLLSEVDGKVVWGMNFLSGIIGRIRSL